MRDSFDPARYFLNLSKSSFNFTAVCSKNLKRCGLYERLGVRPRGNVQRTRALRRKEVNLSTKVIRYEMIEHQTRYASISRKQDQTASIGRLFFNAVSVAEISLACYETAGIRYSCMVSVIGKRKKENLKILRFDELLWREGCPRTERTAFARKNRVTPRLSSRK